MSFVRAGSFETALCYYGGKMNIYWSVLNYLDNKVTGLKLQYISRKNDLFLRKYSLIEGEKKKREGTKYNPYEGSDLVLINKLIQTGIIKKTDTIIDIGSGAGIFLIYLHSVGFTKLYGIEMDKDNLELARENIEKYRGKVIDEVDIKLLDGDATSYTYPDDINVFYFFNPFYSTDAYDECFNRIFESLNRYARNIKVIFLYPTMNLQTALNKNRWLKRLWRIHEEGYPCSKCIHFLVYGNIL